ncbi:MAG TPA: heparan-alpha-glucosaminide N-acetyltransferase domain-containing protein, partial [Methanomicrobiales archaeon]|nr:heparan-alpha-glucosaminide N-acetyltransferase domain-containing protein [Methanomicrobiales archaeon]
SIDYAPLFPWFGVVLIGLYLGGVLYPRGQRRFSVPEWKNPVGAFFALLGRNSLVIYMAHIPIILLIIALFFPDAVAPLL